MPDACPNCQAPVAPGARFCGSCGTSLAVAPAPAAPPPAADVPVTAAPPPAPDVTATAAPPPPPPVDPPRGAGSGAGAAPPPAMPLTTEAARGFLASLFDMSFSNFVATRVIPVLYVLAIIGIGITYLGVGFSLLKTSSGGGLLWFILVGPLFALFDLIWIRVVLEIAIVFFRIRENTHDILGTVQRRA